VIYRDVKANYMWNVTIYFLLLQAKEPWETTPEEKMSLAIHHKAKGTDCFKVELL